MELVPGGSSCRLLSRGPHAPNTAARLVSKVARALDHAHQRGVLHRDIKPSNRRNDARNHSRMDLTVVFGFLPSLSRRDPKAVQFSRFEQSRNGTGKA